MVALSIIGVLVSHKVRTSDDWALTGRSLGALPLAGTYFATITSSGTMIGYVGSFYALGWGGAWICAGTALTSILAAAFFAPKLRMIGKVTLPDYLEDRFGRLQSTLSSLLILFATIFLTCAQIIGAANLLSIISGWRLFVCVITVSVLFICFTMTGGMLSVAWTDTLCTIIMVIGLWIAAIYLVWGKLGGLGQLHQAMYAADPSLLDPLAGGMMPVTSIISWTFTWGFGNFGAPQFITRFYCAKDAHVARISQGYVGMMMAAFYFPLILVSLSGRVLLPGITVPDQVSSSIIRNLLPSGLGGLMMAAIFAACISTADSVLLLASTTATNDLYRKYINKNADSSQLLRFARASTMVIGIAAAIASILVTDTILWIQASMITLMGSAISASVLIGLVWKRANKQGGLASCILGFLTCVLWYLLDQPLGLMPIIPSMIVSSLAMVIVSLITPPPSCKVTERFFPRSSL